MARFDFCSGSYTLQSITADAQKCLNLYPQRDELGDARSKMILLQTPGLASLVQLDGAPRGSLEFNGRLFVIAGTKLYEINLTAPGIPATVSTTVLGSGLANDGLPASLAANEIQLLMCSGGKVYLYVFSTGAFSQLDPNKFTLSTGPAPVLQVAFCDSFFLALIKNSQTICISNVLDGANWNLNGQIVVSVFPENIIGMIVDHREVWVIGEKKSAVYYASETLDVFDVAPGGYIEQGGAAPFAISQCDNAVFFIGGGQFGDCIGWRTQGYAVARITTHAVEWVWQSYPSRSDAVSYAYQDQGHTFWVVLFPSANAGNGATWVYDVATGLWHERDLLNEKSGASMGHPSWNHAFWKGMHIVGDWRSNNLYQMDANILDNAGVPIIRLRRAPHISTELQLTRHIRLELDMETGLPSAGTPQVSMRFSDDGAHTWSNSRMASAGASGQYKTRVFWIGLGTARIRTYEIRCSDAIPFRIVDAYLTAAPGYQPSERLSRQYQKVG